MIQLDDLRRYPYFSGIQTNTLAAIAVAGEEQHYKAGEILFREGARSEYFFVLEEGEVEILYELKGGPRVVDTLGAGDLLGWSSIVEPHRATASAVARVDCLTLRIDGSRLLAQCKADTTFGYKLMTHITRALSRRIDRARIRFAAAQ